jgi:hypothetical protein
MTVPRDDIAGKVNPAYARGDLVRVAGARHQVEAEFIQGLLLEEGIPSILRRTAGFDVPEFMASGPRDVMVPGSGAPAAREVLLQADLLGAPSSGPKPWRLLATMVAVLALVALVIFLIDTLG